MVALETELVTETEPVTETELVTVTEPVTVTVPQPARKVATTQSKKRLARAIGTSKPSAEPIT